MTNLTDKHRVLGILACSTNHHPPFAERAYYEQLTKVGKSLGVAIVVFSPRRIDWRTRQVHGYVYSPALKQWYAHTTVLPSVIYDRCFYVSSAHYERYRPFVQKLRRDPQTELLGVPLKGKWQLAQLIRHSEQLSRYFPHTERYVNPGSARAFIQRYRALVAKPSAGSHGRGIVAVMHHKASGRYLIFGRTKENTPLSQTCDTLDQTLAWLHRFIGPNRYLLQPYLKLRTPNHLPFDIRILMQKDERHAWQTTGIAVRTGRLHSLTSNLHGGGRAVKFRPFLLQLPFEPHVLKRIEQDIRVIKEQLPPLIERKHGRLCELGIDVGIDVEGRVWLLEVNSKPGRQVFRQAGEREMYLAAIRRPVLYANALLKRRAFAAPPTTGARDVGS